MSSRTEVSVSCTNKYHHAYMLLLPFFSKLASQEFLETMTSNLAIIAHLSENPIFSRNFKL